MAILLYQSSCNPKKNISRQKDKNDASFICIDDPKIKKIIDKLNTIPQLIGCQAELVEAMMNSSTKAQH